MGGASDVTDFSRQSDSSQGADPTITHTLTPTHTHTENWTVNVIKLRRKKDAQFFFSNLKKKINFDVIKLN